MTPARAVPVAALLLTLLGAAGAAAEPPPLVGPHERLVVVAPHPDDETLGAAGLIRHVLAAGGSVRVILLTAGDGYVEAVAHDTGEPRPRPAEFVAYGERRLMEARGALRTLDGAAIRLQVLGFPDGGLAPLLRAHWRRDDPEHSPTTAATRPPYPEALAPTLAYDGDDLRRELVQLLREAAPTIVALPDPLDRHPDHAATGTFTLLALQTRLADGAPLPRLLAYLVHWPGWPPGWDATRPDAVAERRPLLPPAGLPDRGLARVTLVLSADDRARKRAALARYASQQEVMPALLAAFVRRTEPFTVLTEAEVRSAGVP